MRNLSLASKRGVREAEKPQRTKKIKTEPVKETQNKTHFLNNNLNNNQEKGAYNVSRIMQKMRLNSVHALPCLQRREYGMPGILNTIRQSVLYPLCRSLDLDRTLSVFDRRCTALEWHPTCQDMLVVGSKGGDVILWNINNINTQVHINGDGAGGSIQALKFLPTDSRYVLTASINGTITQHDLEGKHTRILADTMNCHDFWFCSVDASVGRKSILAGENNGKLHMISLDGIEIWNKKVHSGKITHVEWSSRDDNVVCTASLDKTCRVWDVRMINDKRSAVATLSHDKPINSAYFDSSGCRLLTTDQYDEMRVYSAPSWQIHTTIKHPHRHFRHMTPQKACWHPHEDVVAVGRYPDPKFPGYSTDEKRSIDVYDVQSGDIITQLHNSAASGIVSLCKFNPQGDILAATMGVNVLIWRPRRELEPENLNMEAQSHDKQSNRRGNNSRQPGNTNRRNAGERKKKDAAVTQKKLKLLTQTQTKKEKK